jgi:hypothetical protein
VLDDPEVQRRAEPVTDRVAPNFVSEEEGDNIPCPPDDQSKADQGTPSQGTQSEDERGHKIETTPSPIGKGHKISSRRKDLMANSHTEAART